MEVEKLKIGDFRRAVDSLNWSRNDLSGATQAEFIAMDVKARLERHITIVQAMLSRVPARFVADIQGAESGIDYARKTIVRWEEKRKESEKVSILVALPERA